MAIEKIFDVKFITGIALREKQIQQNYRPYISIHKWFARRPGSLFRGLVLSEFSNTPLAESFYTSNNLDGITIADPFMGGGTPLVEANRVGCNVIGFDINPMAYWIVNEEITNLNLEQYRQAADKLVAALKKEVGAFYRTRCGCCGSDEAQVKYFLWVKTQTCRTCGEDIDLFPGYLLAADRRHPKNVFVCPQCGNLHESVDRDNPGACASCGQQITRHGPAGRNRCACPKCRAENDYPSPDMGPPQHRMFAIEYYCSQCKPTHSGRFFKRPDDADLAKYGEAATRHSAINATFVPPDEIPGGDETDRLLRWGYRRYREMFNARQLLGLELSCRDIAKQNDERIRRALATNLSDLLRYQNMLCRYDAAALKSLDIFSVHGFPVGLIQCESNLLGISNGGGTNVGSGGWTNIIDKYAKAKAYCDRPFEILHTDGKKRQVNIKDEWIGEHVNGNGAKRRQVKLYCQTATNASIPPSSLDAVFTDPPYFGNVQYAELMDFCYVWLRRIIGGSTEPAFKAESTRNVDELTGNITMARGLSHFAQGLSDVFRQMAIALKPGAPLAFTYHHNQLSAYYPLAVAMLDAGLACSASLPCAAEMSASIHINGTGSSVIDTIFVCRSTGRVPSKWIAKNALEVAALIRDDLGALQEGGLKPTKGDIRCITYGHLTRLAIWNLRTDWDSQQSIEKKLQLVSDHMECIRPSIVEECLANHFSAAPGIRQAEVCKEDQELYALACHEISF